MNEATSESYVINSVFFLDHNRIHAADVLHGCYYLTCHPVRAFLGAPSTPPESPVPVLDNSPLPISESMSTLEVPLLYFCLTKSFPYPRLYDQFFVNSLGPFGCFSDLWMKFAIHIGDILYSFFFQSWFFLLFSVDGSIHGCSNAWLRSSRTNECFSCCCWGQKSE